MSIVRADILKRIENALQDNAEKLPPDDRNRCLTRAVLLYSRDRPLRKINEETGDGSTFQWALPSDWVDGFSFIDEQIEYPASTLSASDQYQAPCYLDNNDWMIYKKLVDSVTTRYLRFPTFVPAIDNVVRYSYTTLHTLAGETNTISEGDAEAVVSLGTALCFWALAAKFAQSIESTIDADVVDYQRISDMYAELAKQRIAEYRSYMGIGNAANEGRGAASAGTSYRDLDIVFAHGEDYITHPARTR